ncbi:MAG: hypothetical protein A2Z73_00175 [Deltaproteobacteria bacterium RBG_13_60_28]|nr:MAG: hypothetical protein A2Z73_00175 [Deltaproteobacteria bacterium RBG_13_60_28]
MKIDDWFKLAILVLAAIFLFIFGLHALKGRYRPIFEDFAILDTFTGNVYKLSGERVTPETFDLPQYKKNVK